MRKFNVDAEIIFTHVYTLSLKSKMLPFQLGSFSHFVAHEKYFAERADLNEYVLLYTIAGEGELLYQGKEYRITNNQIILLDGGIHHIYRTVGEEDWEIYFMLISGVGVKAYYDFLFSNGFYILNFFDTAIFKKTINTLLYMDSHHLQNFEILAGHQIHELLTQLSILNNEVENLDLTLATEYIENHIEKKITVDELAQICHLSKYYFIRKFKNIYGETPHEFITRLKINHAKQILIQSSQNVSEVGLAVGYEDITTFIRAFKMLTGTTPNKYRKNMMVSAEDNNGIY